VGLGDEWIEGLDICVSITRLDEGKIQRKAGVTMWLGIEESFKIDICAYICVSELTII
jgi:hypothetical protein